MNRKQFIKEYEAPAILPIDIQPESVMCASNVFGLNLEEMEEHDYTFNW
ncbi:MAG: hypothetical protein IJ005_00250 [Bacteroidales bacterium]|nr:hypothetical protein [Bacteroidales bacterium]